MTDKTYTAAELAPLIGRQPSDITRMFLNREFKNAYLDSNRVIRIPEQDCKTLIDAFNGVKPADQGISLPEVAKHVETAKDEVKPAQEQVVEVPKDTYQEIEKIKESARKEVEQILKDADDYSVKVRKEADDYSKDTRTSADVYADKIRGNADNEVNLLKQNAEDSISSQKLVADNYYKEKIGRADEYYKTKISQGDEEYKKAVQSRESTLATLDKRIKDKVDYLQEVSGNINKYIEVHNKLLKSAERNRDYHYNLAMSNTWGKFISKLQGVFK
jgi:hypothetical protein